MKKIALMFLLLPFQVVPDDLNTNLTATQQDLYQGIIQEVRCLVCQNQSIAESNAELAKDLREEVFQQVEQGRNEAQVKSYLKERYGDFVLYEPSFKQSTYFLWLSPVLILILILGWLRKIGVF
ncbi:MAG: cytochrome c-type biogenesis protein CcmH [Gammaproteobacteria bacterium]|nr:cytochrome c-type biogenesis protein CcmH [Gammaproteobacteria bacterium]